MKRAAALTALFITGLFVALTLAGGGLSWYSTSTQTETTGTTETTTEVTATVLCQPNNGGKDGHEGNDACKPDETTPPETTPPQLTISIGVATTAPPVTTTEATTESTETTPPATEPVPPVSKPPVAHKPKGHNTCPDGSHRDRNGGQCFRNFHGTPHPVVQGSG